MGVAPTLTWLPVLRSVPSPETPPSNLHFFLGSSRPSLPLVLQLPPVYSPKSDKSSLEEVNGVCVVKRREDATQHVSQYVHPAEQSSGGWRPSPEPFQSLGQTEMQMRLYSSVFWKVSNLGNTNTHLEGENEVSTPKPANVDVC